MYSFDETESRIGTNSFKWDDQKNTFGTDGLLPFWVADSDFKAAPEIISALKHRVDHGIYGYTVVAKEYLKASADWLQRRHGWRVNEQWNNIR